VTDKFYNYFDVDGDKDIREALEQTKPKKIKAPDKLGGLDVVDAEDDFEADMEKRKKETQIEIYGIDQQREDDKGFLNDFDGRLDGVKKNVDVTEEELAEHRAQMPEVEEGAETGAPAADEEYDPKEMLKDVNDKIKELTDDDEEESESSDESESAESDEEASEEVDELYTEKEEDTEADDGVPTAEEVTSEDSDNEQLATDSTTEQNPPDEDQDEEETPEEKPQK